MEFNKEDFLVIKNSDKFSGDTPSTEENVPLENHILSYEHNTWTGYVRSANDRKQNDFADYMRNISRGRA